MIPHILQQVTTCSIHVPDMSPQCFYKTKFYDRGYHATEQGLVSASGSGEETIREQLS